MIHSKILRHLLFTVIFLFIVLAIISSGVTDSIFGFLKLQTHPARLINDFFEIQGIGATLFNSAIVGLLALLLIIKNKVPLSGSTFAGVLTIMGFGLFGKTPLNIVPIIFGVFLSAKFTGKNFNEYLIIALFGTALGPITTFFAFELGLSSVVSLILATGIGVAIGFLLPSLAVSMLHLHQGYNLYNIGLTCGFLGLFLASIIKSTGNSLTPAFNWYSGNDLVLMLLIPILSVGFILTALISNGLKSFKSFLKIQKLPGRLPSDFMIIEDIPGALINSGLLGICGTIFVLVVDADFNGPVIGGLLTVMGFGAFGTHLRNSWSLVLGVILSSLIFKLPLNAPGPILAAIFVTTLSPIAGQFGVVAGVISGFIHLFVVMHSASWHGGINLYNNGFAGGLTATLFVAIFQWYKTNKERDHSESPMGKVNRKELIPHFIGELSSYILESDPNRMVVSLHQEETGLHLCILDSNKHSDEEIAEIERTLNSEKRPELVGYYGAMTGHDLLGKSRLDLLGWQVKHSDVSKTDSGIKIDLWMGGSEFQNDQFSIPKSEK